MKREKLLTRQGGERLLGSRSLVGEDFVSSCVRLSTSPLKRHRDHAGVPLLHAARTNDIVLEQHDPSSCYDHNSKTRDCVTRTLQILEHDWVPLPADNDDDDDCQSYTTVGTGMPSLASINPGSVTEASCSLHSSCGFSRFSSMTSISSNGNNNNGCDPEQDNCSTTSQSISIVSEEPALRHRMRVLLLEDINEDARAETLDCLEPVLVSSSRDSSNHEKTRWGSPPCDAEITVCRPQEHYESSRNPKPRNHGGVTRHHQHELASRNADEAPPLPPPVNRILSIDQSPMIPPRRYCTSEVYVRPTNTVDIDRRKSWDHIPYKPQRKNSNSRCAL